MARAEVDQDEVYLNVMKALKQVDLGYGATQVEILKFLMDKCMNPDPEMNELELGSYIREALKRGIQYRMVYRTNSDGKYHITNNPPGMLPVQDEGPPTLKRSCPMPKNPPKSASTPPNPTSSGSGRLFSSVSCSVNGAMAKQEMAKSFSLKKRGDQRM